MNQEEWISASEYAERLNVSTQTVYNRVRSGSIESKKFKRGSYNGIIVKWNGSQD